MISTSSSVWCSSHRTRISWDRIHRSRRLLARSSKRLESDLVERPRSRSEALAILGDSYYSLGVDEVAAEHHRKAAEIEAELAPGSSDHLQRWYRWMHVDSSQATAQVSVERGRELLLAIRGGDELLPDALYADILGWFGRRLGDTNEFDEMLTVYDELERLHERTPTDAVAAEVLRLRMHCRSSQARWGEALAAAQELASLLEQQPGLTSELDYEQVQQSATHLAMRVGRREDALAAHTKTLDHTIQVLGPDHSTLAVMWSNQATLMRMVGRHADAEEPYKEALRISRLTRTPPHDTIAINLNNLGALHRYLGNYEQAQELLEEALRMLIQLNGEQHVKVANAMSNVVDIHFDQRHLPEALDWQRRCLAMRRELVGNGHFETVNGCFRLARIEIANGDSGRGLELLEEALPRTRELDPGGRLKVLQTAIDAARELAAAATTGENGVATTPADLEPAVRVARETLAQVLEIAPDRKDAILRHRTVLGVVLWRAGELDDAVRQFEGGRKIAGEGRPQDVQKLETRIAEFQAATGRAVPAKPAQGSAEQSQRPTDPGK
ncbi:MAG: tetratricopeptide repeat protein [bacterium]|nr:tetratricopeptide repeat protein [bacterium]